MYRFFVPREQISEGEIIITGKDVNHIKNVLRMKIGEQLLISNGSDREYKCRIENMDGEQVTAHILDIDGPQRELPIKVTLFQALPKGDKMETVIQKMIELGAYSVVPVSTKRCVVKLDYKKAQAKTKRWNLISESAAKQSKRGVIPEVSSPIKFDKAIEIAQKMDIILVPYEEAKDMDYTRQVIDTIKPGMSVGIFIGPEGGFDKEEVEQAINIGAKSITLGKRILRTETAGMALMSVLMFAMEE